MPRIRRPRVVVHESEYWRWWAEQPPLELLPKPCHDCAMVTGYYRDSAERLLRQPQDVVERVRKTWYCHHHPDRACKGLDEYLTRRICQAAGELQIATEKEGSIRGD